MMEEDNKEIDTSLNVSKRKNEDNNTSIYLDPENNQIVMQLIEIGYSKLYSKRLLAYYHPKSIEEALNYFLKENGIIQHFFIEEKKENNKVCFLCGDKKEIHLGYIPEKFHKLISEDNNFDNINSKNILINEIINENDNNINNNLISSNNKNNLIDSLTIKKEEECPICSNLFFQSENNTLEKCGHSFCDNCWFQFLSIKIKENKLTFIKCLDYECQEKLSDKFIINLLKSNKNLINQFNNYKFELDIINNPNKKFCPYPQCNSYAELKNITEKNVKCLNNHEFCFLCLEKPHKGKPCKDILDKSMEEFSKNNFIKKCPHCGIIIEKSEGCNHITCSKCNYQWCWLCNEKYTEEHFREGKCKGFQFFKPKNENDIKLAFEGKIILNQSQLQQDIEYIDRPFRRRRRRDIRNRRLRREDYDDFWGGYMTTREIANRSRFSFFSLFKLNRKITNFISFIIYLLFGHLLIFYRIFTFDNFEYNFFAKRFSFFIFLLISLPIFFIQMIMNFIMFPFYIKKLEFNNLFPSFDEEIISFTKNLISFFLHVIILILGAEIFIIFYHFINIKKGFTQKILLLAYTFIGFFHLIIYFTKYLVLDSIGIIIRFICRDKKSFSEYIEYLMEPSHFLFHFKKKDY